MLCVTGYSFAAVDDIPVNADGSFISEEDQQEAKKIKSHFECYDMTSDVELTICMNETLHLFDEVLQGIYREKVSLSAGNKTYFFKRDLDKWMALRESKCGAEADCYIRLYKQKIVEAQNSPEIAKLNFTPSQGHDSVPISFFGRRVGSGYYVDRIRFQVLKEGKRKTEEFYMHHFLNEKNWEMAMPSLKLNQLDANFDGFDDLVFFLGGQGKKGRKAAYLLFDNETLGFKYNAGLNGLDISYFNEEHGLIHVDWQQEDGSYGTDFYNYSPKGLVQRAFRHVYANFTDPNGLEKVKRTMYRLWRKRMVKIATDSIDKNQIGDLPEAMFREQ